MLKIKRFENNEVTITNDYILMRDCVNISSRDLLIINLNETIYLEFININLDNKSCSRLAKIAKIDIELDSIIIKWLRTNTDTVDEKTDIIYVPHIIGGSRVLPVYQPIERLVNTLI